MAKYSDNTPENPSPVDATIQQQMKEGRYQFTDEEKRALRECRFESFWYSSFPIAAVSGLSTHMLVQRGVLNPSKRFGSIPKAVFATMCGYIFGKMLYVQKCREKFLKLENSPFAEMMRRGRGGMPPAEFGGMSIPGYGTGSNPPVEEELSVDDNFRPDTPWSGGHDQRLNMDIDTSQVKGINSFDSDLAKHHEDERAASKREFTGTYDELRKHHRAKNAQQYTQVLPGHYQPRSPPDVTPHQDQPRPKLPAQDEFSLGARNRNKMLNKYGDSWEKE
ncbi:OCIA domain-containing protein 1-like [Lytechinus pictus]|uniref:OCIA domain-containing protein 1-like n=1 Tax=Lytechinus pictus TaxID=7653 RepID=UPI00240D6509|nr:OCIA domain-containing protein 1-like [Lytechinus pictus]